MMAILQRNIWFLFYVILCSGIIIFSLTIYKFSADIKHSYKIEQENLLQLSNKSIESIFLQYETVLNILGEQLTQNENYKSVQHAQNLLDDILKSNTTLIAFGLAKPNGELYVVSSNLKDANNLPNLLEKEQTKDSFLETLNNKKMIVGRTYFHKALDTLIIPIRKAIFNEKGEVLAVMTAGINVQKSLDYITLNKHNIHNITIFRDKDYYQQLFVSREKKYLNLYEKPLSRNFVENAVKKIEEKYNKTIDEIKTNEIMVTIDYTRYIDKTPIMMSGLYINRYHLWAITETPLPLIEEKVIKNALMLFFIFVSLTLVIYYLFKYIDNYEQKKKEILKYHITHDYLTQLYNRYYLSEKFEQVEHKKSYFLLFIDLDNFKTINDNYGHEYGDQILKTVSSRLLKLASKKEDTIVRYSGDEFLFIRFENEASEIEALAKKIIADLSEPYLIKPYNLILSCSVGIAQFPKDGKSFDEIKRYADIAMYESKIKKQSYTFFNEHIKNKFLEKTIMEQELKTALQNNEIYMMYQPQVNQDASLYGVEALVRWENKNLGFVPPDKFIKVAEEIGLMPQLGRFIIKTTLNEMQKLQKELNQEFQVAINISVKQFMEIDFYEDLVQMIKEIEFNQIKITLEITENVFINDVDFILKLLNKLRSLNILISLDDFGTGYSSLSLLKKLPIDELKIDKSFVDDILVDKEALSMVASIITIGKKLNMTILAEGIENIEQKEVLESYGCDLFQGYYFSRPLKIDALKGYVSKK